MCHHVDMAIDWDEVVTTDERETAELNETDEANGRTVDNEKSTPEVTYPADD